MIDRTPYGPAWRVLLIGGASGAGKTTLARQLAYYYEGVTVLAADDIRVALQRVTTPELYPNLHFFTDDPELWAQPPEVLRDALLGVADLVSTALEAVIARHVNDLDADPIVIEGDVVLPGLARKWGSVARAVILHEENTDVLARDIAARNPGFFESDPDRLDAVVAMNAQYAAWLLAEASYWSVPVLAVRPRDTLRQRLLDAIE